MKELGLVRKVDDLGRIVVPVELRRNLGIDIKDPVEFFVDGNKIVLKKYVPKNACVVTGEVSPRNMSLADGKIVISERGLKILLEEIRAEFANKKQI
ncbi:AbrB/MazE/SpoVT family DNA-binding domain-containing protein [Bacillus mexicanus]|uniref:AbrB/MazE/SpoVT family DNA-binding domain-containing protein n=1 Tax=Bacillus mexicanus TaxID=2834415 RepID=UPI003D20D46A